MSRIGIMGGTFNPIHTGHLIIAQQALTLLKLDKIWFMPAGDPPHKNNRILDKDSRKRMVELAIQNNPDFELFTYELEKERPSYSAITMTELGKLNFSLSWVPIHSSILTNGIIRRLSVSTQPLYVPTGTIFLMISLRWSKSSLRTATAQGYILSIRRSLKSAPAI